jgi:hypothetical protein
MSYVDADGDGFLLFDDDALILSSKDADLKSMMDV